MVSMVRTADFIDRWVRRLGQLLSWLVLGVVLVAISVTVLRYWFSRGWVWMQDLYLWMNAAMFMLGAAYTLLTDKHVRVDFIYQRRGPRFRAGVNVFGTIFFLLPTVVFIWIYSFPYVAAAWARREGALDAGGLPSVYLLKTVLLGFCLLLGLQGLSVLLRGLVELRKPESANEGEGA